MWPFTKKEPVSLLDRFHLTPEEKREVSIIFDSFTTPQGRKIGKEPHSPAVNRGLTAYALWNYAEQKMLAADLDPNSLNRELLIDTAVEAIRKAYQIHHLPIYLFDLAQYLEANGRLTAADTAYRAFLEDQAEYKSGEGDYIFLQHRDIEKSLQDAEESMNQL